MPAALKADPTNARTHGDRSRQAIRDSLEKLGAGRSIVADAAGTIIAGNGVADQAKRLRIPTRTVETDGSELVVVKRTDLAPDDPKRTALALADNQVGTLSRWDEVQLPALLAELNADLRAATGFSQEEARRTMDDTAAELAKASIRAEEEWRPAADTADRAADAVGAKLRALAAKHPDRMAHAAAVVIPAGPTRECLILADPDLADIIAELRRLHDAGEDCPLSALLAATVKL